MAFDNLINLMKLKVRKLIEDTYKAKQLSEQGESIAKIAIKLKTTPRYVNYYFAVYDYLEGIGPKPEPMGGVLFGPSLDNKYKRVFDFTPELPKEFLDEMGE